MEEQDGEITSFLLNTSKTSSYGTTPTKQPLGNNRRPQASMGDRVTGRKARVLQMEEIGCKYRTLLSLLSIRRKQTSDIFFSFSIKI